MAPRSGRAPSAPSSCDPPADFTIGVIASEPALVPTHAHTKSGTAQRDAPLPAHRGGHGEETARAVAHPGRAHPFRRRRGAAGVAGEHQTTARPLRFASREAPAVLHHL